MQREEFLFHFRELLKKELSEEQRKKEYDDMIVACGWTELQDHFTNAYGEVFAKVEDKETKIKRYPTFREKWQYMGNAMQRIRRKNPSYFGTFEQLPF
jgi:hypothetical protein